MDDQIPPPPPPQTVAPVQPPRSLLPQQQQQQQQQQKRGANDTTRATTMIRSMTSPAPSMAPNGCYRTPPRRGWTNRSVWSTGRRHHHHHQLHSKKPRMTPSPTILRYPPNTVGAAVGTPSSSSTATTIAAHGNISTSRYTSSNNNSSSSSSNNNNLYTTSCITPTKLYHRSGSDPVNNNNKNIGTPSSSGAADRFIPSRRGMSLELSRSALFRSSSLSSVDSRGGTGNTGSTSNPDGSSSSPTNSNPTDEKATQSPAETPIQKEYKRRMMSSICNVPLDMLDEDAQPRRVLNYNSTATDGDPISTNATLSTAAVATNVVRQYVDENNNSGSTTTGGGNGASSPWRAIRSAIATRSRLENPYQHDTLRVLQQFDSMDDPTLTSSVSGSETMIHRKIPTQPSRILDAPDLVDDFYLNLISWSADNILAVALAHCVYLWNASTGEIQHLTTIEGDDDYVTSVSWCTAPGQAKYLAIGTNSHAIQLWDTQASRLVRTLRGHAGRVASMAWNQHWLSSGGRDSLILQHDVRAANHLVSRYKAHEQEVCGLAWNDEGNSLASGGNENYLCIWDAAMSMSSSRSQSRRSSNHRATDIAPRLILKKHKAAVKALDWCPFNRGLLATGGGTADRTIKLWNSNSGAMLRSIDTGSQVCSVVWSKHNRELCSSHGFSENQLILWKYGSRSSLTKVKELTGHTARILSLACSPDGSTVVSAAGDESLRFWNVFGSAPRSRSSILPMGEMTFGMHTIR